MPAQSARRWTTTEVRALIERSTTGERFELVDGALLVTSAPRPAHQRGVQALFVALGDDFRQQPVGEVMCSPADLELTRGRIT
jgi:hypothetical protein